MTVLLLQNYSAFAKGAIVTLDNATEASLVAQGLASYTTNPGSAFFPLTATEQQTLRTILSGMGASGALGVTTGGLLFGNGYSFSASMGESAVLFGDSWTQRCTGYLTPTSVTRSGSIVTCVLASHGLGSGKIIDFNNATDSTYNVRNVAITRVDANTFTFVAAGPNGAATAIATRSLIVTLQEQVNDDGYWLWLFKTTRFGACFRMVKNAGIASNNSTDMLARVATDVLVYQSDWVLFRPTLYNDIVNAGYTLAQIIALNAQILAALLAAGRKVLLIGPPAFNTGNTTARHQIWLGAIKWMREQARTTPGVYFADAYAKQVNATAGTPGNAIAGMLAADGIHESPRGADQTAQAMYDAIGTIVSKYQPFVSSSGDNYGADPSNTNILDYGFWTNSGGTINAATGGGAASGTLGGNFQADAVLTGGGATAVWSMPARSDGIGFNAQNVFTPGAANDFVRIRLLSNIAAARWTAGGKLRLAQEVGITNLSGSNVRSINNVLSFQGGSNPTAVSVIQGQATAAASWPQSDFTLQFVSNDIVVPTDAGLTGADIQVLYVAGASGTAATCFNGRMNCEKVS